MYNRNQDKFTIRWYEDNNMSQHRKLGEKVVYSIEEGAKLLEFISQTIGVTQYNESIHDLYHHSVILFNIDRTTLKLIEVRETKDYTMNYVK